MVNERIRTLKRDYKINSYGAKSDYHTKKIANTRDLNRILIYLSFIPYSTRTDIAKEASVRNYVVNDALLFLTKQKLIKLIYNEKGIAKSYKVFCLSKNEAKAKDILRELSKEINKKSNDRNNKKKLQSKRLCKQKH